eukprot:CAMPEP_0204254716 /NCGR_PEP_ID=MMETSP0468-20130131/2727_1 /ASSEMBLY_ACC=CAM_ASM_000383 /TAXON_ID=2969 /ORGANISM="Oxyrrhis marina" /LENGTH=397 /DNA_ID=CAMNT_0051228489 /DNA_START=42 /DNA_END=1236 /DNA_ORIENTATION=-
MTPGRERDAFAQYTVRDEATARIAAAQWKSIRAWRHSRQGGTPRLRSACSGAPVRGIPHPLGNNSRGSQGCIFPDKSDPFRETQEEYYYRLTTAVPSLPERLGPVQGERPGPVALGARSGLQRATTSLSRAGVLLWRLEGAGRTRAPPSLEMLLLGGVGCSGLAAREGHDTAPAPRERPGNEVGAATIRAAIDPKALKSQCYDQKHHPGRSVTGYNAIRKDPRGELGAGSWRWDDATSYTTVFHDRFLANPASSLGATTVAAMEPVYRTGASAAASSRPASSLGWTTATATTGGMESGASDASEYLPPRPKSCDPGTATRQMMPGGPVFGAASYDTTGASIGSTSWVTALVGSSSSLSFCGCALFSRSDAEGPQWLRQFSEELSSCRGFSSRSRIPR